MCVRTTWFREQVDKYLAKWIEQCITERYSVWRKTKREGTKGLSQWGKKKHIFMRSVQLTGSTACVQ